MFRVVFLSQWRESRLAVGLLVAIAVALPVLATWGTGADAGPVADFRLTSTVWQWGAAFPLLALAAALLLGLGAWRPDHRTGHVYALTLPVARPRYMMLRFAAGLVLVAAVAVALWIAALGSTSRLALPSTLQAYPGALALRFLLAAVVAYTLFFSLAAMTPRMARLIVAAVLVLVIATAAAELLHLRWSPLPRILQALFSPHGPLGVFLGRWMLIDV